MGEKTSNYSLVGEGFRALLSVLAPFLAIELRSVFRKKWWEQGVLAKLDAEQKRDLPGYADNDDELTAKLDIYRCLLLLRFHWRDIFVKKLSKDHLTWANELCSNRNTWAHQGAQDIRVDDAERTLDTMARLCEQLDSIKAEAIRKLKRTVAQGGSAGASDSEQSAPSKKSAQPEAQKIEVPQAPTLKGLPGWREVITPHPDVAKGEYITAEFAADLSLVARGEGSVEYNEPTEFFSRTFMTNGIKGLVKECLKRVSSRNGEPVIQLKTSFGGGKTHSMLVLYHLMRGQTPLGKVPEIKPILTEIGLSELPKVNVAVLVGTALDPAKIKEYPRLPGQTVSTLWGEMAAQLAMNAGRPELYELVKDGDKKGVSPGSETLKELFDAAGPCLILIDEMVAYGRRIYGIEGLPAGSFDNFLSFIQSLTEGLKASKNSLAVATLPESIYEVGGDSGKAALRMIERTFGRVESIWKPVASSEGFEVVRRRLFLECKDSDARDLVCASFARMYFENKIDFSSQASEPSYLQRLKDCYPIHPEVFDRLYEDWSALENFQRTRGVLRLMAGAIRELWMARDPSLLIMPGSLPFDSPAVRDELTRYLESGDSWNAVIDRDVDGPRSGPFHLDKDTIRYGQIMAARRLARTLMLGSAPTSKENVRGIQKTQALLGTVQPSEEISIFNDALGALQNSLTYLYSDTSGDRFWYDTRPTLRKLVEDKAVQLDNTYVEMELENRLSNLKKTDPFSGIHVCLHSSNEVIDVPTARLVVLHYNYPYKSGDNELESFNDHKAVDILLHHGDSAARTNQNMLVFLAADTNMVDPLQQSTRKYLAWKSVYDDREKLNLDGAQIKDAKANKERASETIDIQLKSTYSWLLTPISSAEGDKKHLIRFEQTKLSSSNEEIIPRVAKALQDSATLIKVWSPGSLIQEMDKLLWINDDHLSVKRLWESLCCYCYLPKLVNYKVLEAAIIIGVRESKLGYAADFQEGKYIGLKLGAALTAIDESGYLVKEKVALKQLEEEKLSIKTSSPTPQIRTGGDGTQSPSGASEPAPPSPPTKFFLSADLSSTRLVNDVGRLVDEILALLSSQNGLEPLRVSLEVEAKCPEGFDPQIEKNVMENCRVLRVRHYQFEK
ncbi:MAG: DUF499 domain-containing protein [Deltaproteobacteria bacterium]|jgi:predicted AAA+ superfamily ATPase|nr:DUF499 domain-containing protein [Deltaproteobacteria bacterium]